VIYNISKFFWFLVLKIFFRLEVSGRDTIPSDSAFILASNHISNIDPLALGVACPRKIHYLGKEELFRGKFAFWWMKKVGVIPLKRGKNDIGAIKIAIRALNGGKPWDFLTLWQGMLSPRNLSNHDWELSFTG